MFVLPYFICSVLTILSAYINGITDPEILWNAGIAAAGGLLAFLLFYHTSLVAVMLTGQTVTGLLATLVLSVYPVSYTHLDVYKRQGIYRLLHK